ncbi:MAG: phage adaptor protein [Cetobacterium sp.]|uniref:phage adaptor protein n=1 Tax=Cetobacterium sp. TaxID=2071632 RepID=UPI003EE81EBD
MLDINTYGDLKRAVATWLNRKDSQTIENIPLMINMAHKQFTRMVKLPYYEVMVSLEAVDGFQFVNIPNNFLAAKHVSVNGVPYNRADLESFLRYKNKGRVRNKYFTRIGEQLHFSPSLKDGDVVEMIYQRDIPEFRNDMDEPYSLLVASDVMLYLTLRHAAIFLRDNEQEGYWMEKAQEAADSLMKQLDEAEWSGSALRVPFVK